MKLTYWASRCLTDHSCYNIRCKTRKEVVAMLADCDPQEWSKPFKVTVDYDDGFDLLYRCLGEGGVYEHEDT